MTKATDAVLGEFRAEAKTTERVLERLPQEKLNWKPHPKSLSLGQLGLHVATAQGGIARMLQKDEHEIRPDAFRFQEPTSANEILSAFRESTKAAGEFLENLTEEQAAAPFTLKSGDRTIFTRSRMSVVRMIMLSHVYHHRGQLSVYLRMLDIPVPSIYGPSADDNPFM